MAYVAGWYLPGYPPEMDPAEFESIEEACEFLIEKLSSLEPYPTTTIDTVQYQRGMGYVEVYAPDGYVYWTDVA
jgi:hypothetical protein